jgi:carboxymethylenebutenolidase
MVSPYGACVGTPAAWLARGLKLFFTAKGLPMEVNLQAGTVQLDGHDGDQIEAYAAVPVGAQQVPGVVVIHHMPGFDDATKEITRRFAAGGYAAICPNLHYREAPGADSDDAAAANRAAGGVPDERLTGDVKAAAAYLRAAPDANGKVGVIGYCSGGRQAFLSGCTAGVDAAVDCYGAFVVGSPPPNFPIAMKPLVDLTPQLGCPLLGMFGNDDKAPSPEQVNELEAALQSAGKAYEFHRYDDAGHGFFAVDRPSYRQAAATDGWVRIFDFFQRHLSV